MRFSKNQKHEIGKACFNLSIVTFATVILGSFFEKFDLFIFIIGFIAFTIFFILGTYFSK